MPDSSQVTISLTFEGDPFKFWEILKAMKKQSESDGVGFECGRVLTCTHEGS
jgi:hypothetical protein